jgi:hypothetical protein
MPTSMRTDCWVEFVVACGCVGLLLAVSMGSPAWCRIAGRSREAPAWLSDAEEACDERSWPQDVRSFWSPTRRVNLQQEVEPQQTERPPRDSPTEDTSGVVPAVK